MIGAHTKAELFAVLLAWKAVRQTGWPQLAPAIAQHATQWPRMDEAGLRAELQSLVDELSKPGCAVRLFWKFGADLIYHGYNDNFLRDSGFTSPSGLLEKNDLHADIGWSRQGAKYRADDFDVMNGSPGVRDIIERQDQEGGTVWVHTVKSAVRAATGEVIGVLGMYEVIDAATAAKLQRRPR